MTITRLTAIAALFAGCGDSRGRNLRGIVYRVGDDGAARYAAGAHISIVGDSMFAPYNCDAYSRRMSELLNRDADLNDRFVDAKTVARSESIYREIQSVADERKRLAASVSYDAFKRIDSFTVYSARTSAAGVFSVRGDSLPRAGWIFALASPSGVFWARPFDASSPDSVDLGEDERHAGDAKLCFSAASDR